MFTHQEFTDALNTAFNIQLNETAKTTLTLTNVSPLKPTGPFQSFYIELSGPLDCPLSQGNYSLQHEKLGTTVIMFTPVEQNAECFIYQAVFSFKPD